MRGAGCITGVRSCWLRADGADYAAMGRRGQGGGRKEGKALPSLFFGRRGRARRPHLHSLPFGWRISGGPDKRAARARGTPGLQPSPWPHALSVEAHEQVVTTDRRKASAFRARCEWLALR